MVLEMLCDIFLLFMLSYQIIQFDPPTYGKFSLFNTILTQLKALGLYNFVRGFEGAHKWGAYILGELISKIKKML